MTRHVDRTTLPDGKWVSTVDMQLDLPPEMGSMAKILGYAFETMVFDRGESIDCERWQTREEAERGHREMVSKWLTTRDEKP